MKLSIPTPSTNIRTRNGTLREFDHSPLIHKRRKQVQVSPELAIQNDLMLEARPLFYNPNPNFKLTFQNYLNGKINNIEMLQILNKSKVETPKMQFTDFMRMVKQRKTINDDSPKYKLLALRQLIESKSQAKKSQSKKSGTENSEIVKQIYDSQNQSRILCHTPRTRILQTMKVSYNIAEKQEISEMSTRYELYADNIQSIEKKIENDQVRNSYEQQKKMRQIKLTIENKHRSFSPFHKVKSHRQIITKKDIQLFDYLYTQKETTSESPKLQMQSQRTIKKINFLNLDSSFVSNSSSIISSYEAKLDSLYSQSHKLQQDLNLAERQSQQQTAKNIQAIVKLHTNKKIACEITNSKLQM